MDTIKVVDAKYLSKYKIEIIFNDGKSRVVDFEDYLFSREKVFTEYRQLSNFKKYKVENGNIVWGKNWDIIFPEHTLYSGKTSSSSKATKATPYMSFAV